MSAADRQADGFPHGTPAGYRDGCRSNGGCLHRGTKLMTCVEANQRYARDKRYRKAYDAGDIILDRETAVDTEAEEKREALARRIVPGIDDHRAKQKRNGAGWVSPADEQMTVPKTPRPTPKPAAAPTTSTEEAAPTAPSVEVPSTPAGYVAALTHAIQADVDEAGLGTPKVRKNAWQHGTSYGYDKKGCRCEPCTVAYHAKNRAKRPGTEDTYKGKYTQALADLEFEREISHRAGQQRDEARDTVQRLTAENSALRVDLATALANLAELAALKPHRPVEAATHTPAITFDLLGDRMVLTIAAEIGAHDVAQLGDYLTVRTAVAS